MDAAVESALIGAAAALVGVGGTVIVAFLGFKNTRAANDAALAAARETTKKTLDATRAGQLADRYTRAIDQLGSSTVDVTIGGIYALERIAHDSPKDYHPTVMEVLAACIRENSGKPLQEPTPRSDIPEPATPERVIRPDIQAAMTVIARRDTKHDLRRINLRRVHLPYADLPRAHLPGADLADTNLAGARLHLADLSGANLIGADLNDADLSGAVLSGAILSGAELRGANLITADLRSAVLWADLSNADLRGADLTGAVLSGADLAGADLRGTDLTGVDLSAAVLRDARWPEHMPVPEGWELDRPHDRLTRVATASELTEPN